MIFKVVLLYILSTNFSIISCKRQNSLLIISLDGMRADKFDEYLQENLNSNFNKIIKTGLKADYMIPSFPSQTFPNHWTLVTGNFNIPYTLALGRMG